MSDLTLIRYGDPRYPYRVDHGPRWMNSLGHHVGCHPGTTIALGTPVGPLTRAARVHAHEVFDKLWKGPGAIMTRSQAYDALSEHMGQETHIGQSNRAQCLEIARWAQHVLVSKELEK